MESLQTLTYNRVYDLYNDEIGAVIPPPMKKQILEEIINGLTEIICKKLDILNTENILYGPRITKEYKSIEHFDYDFSKCSDSEKEICQNIVDGIKKIKCKTLKKPIPPATTHLSLSRNNDSLDVPINIKHIMLNDINHVRSIPLGLLSLTTKYIEQPEYLLQFRYLRKLRCKLPSIDLLDQLHHLEVLELNVDKIITNGAISLDFSHLSKVQDLTLYTDAEALNNPVIPEFTILGLKFLNLKSLCLKHFAHRCNVLNVPWMVTCEKLTLDFINLLSTRRKLEIRGLIFCHPRSVVAMGYNYYLKHLHFIGYSELFIKASEFVTSLNLQNSGIAILDHLINVEYLTITADHKIIAPPRLKALSIATPVGYSKGDIYIDLSHCTNLIGVSSLSRHIVLNIPPSVKWFFGNNNIYLEEPYDRLLKHVNILYTCNALSLENLLDNPNIQIVISRNGNYNNHNIDSKVLKLSKSATILMRTIPPGYLLKNMQELYKYS